jgi:hypothetical protein
LQEFREKKFVENFVLYHFWDLFKKIKIFFIGESLILIVLPFVFEMIFNPSFEVKLNRILLIELFNNPKELGKTISIVKSPIELFNLINHLDELAHNE